MNQGPQQAALLLAATRVNMYAISRIQAKPGIWCWAVAIRRRGKAYYKSFYDLRRGGSKKALAAAIAWRDRLLASTQTLNKREFRQLLRSDNSSGVPGVLFIQPKSQPQGSWQAKLRLVDGRSIAKTFSVRKYGKRSAFERAVAARANMLALIDDRPYVHHPTAKKFAAGPATKAKRSG